MRRGNHAGFALLKRLRWERVLLVLVIIGAVTALLLLTTGGTGEEELPEKPKDDGPSPDLCPPGESPDSCGSQECAQGTDC